MELGKVHKFMAGVKLAQEGRRTQTSLLGGTQRAPLTGEEMDLYNEILAKPMLETVQVRVFVKYPWMDEAEWETHGPIVDYDARGGALCIREAGWDLDGDWAPLKFIVYAEGVWMRLEADAGHTVENPYFVEPVVSGQ